MMPHNNSDFLTRRCHALAFEARTRPATAHAARNWLTLMERRATASGDTRVVKAARWAQKLILA